jgi:hypothetical protein
MNTQVSFYPVVSLARKPHAPQLHVAEIKVRKLLARVANPRVRTASIRRAVDLNSGE